MTKRQTLRKYKKILLQVTGQSTITSLLAVERPCRDAGNLCKCLFIRFNSFFPLLVFGGFRLESTLAGNHLKFDFFFCLAYFSLLNLFTHNLDNIFAKLGKIRLSMFRLRVFYRDVVKSCWENHIPCWAMFPHVTLILRK